MTSLVVGCAVEGTTNVAPSPDRDASTADAGIEDAPPNPDAKSPTPPAESSGTPLAAGRAHTCIVKSGAVKCWGALAYEKTGGYYLGRTVTTTPKVVASGVSTRARVFARGPRTCILDEGRVECLGPSFEGGFDPSKELAGASLLALGNEHVCGLLGDGRVRCLGENIYGEVGSAPSLFAQADVAGLSTGVTSLAAGNGASFAIGGGGVRAWGSNSHGQLGDGTGRDSSSLVAVTSLGTQPVLAVGDLFACALASGRVKCWGSNTAGAVGDGGDEDRKAPVDVFGLNDVTSLAAGSSHACALAKTGAVKCWGENWGGRLGDGTETDRHAPVDVGGLDEPVSSIVAGTSHTCAVLMTGAVKCWGSNESGQVGNGKSGDGAKQLIPAEVLGL